MTLAAATHDMNQIVGTHDLLFLVLDTLRYDVAVSCLEAGRTPTLGALLPGGRWEERWTPGNFTYAAHQAFFAGFLPTPLGSGPHPRLFAPRFPGSESTAPTTFVVDSPDWIGALAQRGYHTACVGGTGFFNPTSPLGRVLPGLFQESHWDASLGVSDPDSTQHQVQRALAILGARPADERLLLYVNVSAIHQPNCHYSGDREDTLESHAAALAYVDGQLGALFEALRARGPTFCIVCSDHGTAYGEDGLRGHRINHPVVNTVPYAEFLL